MNWNMQALIIIIVSSPFQNKRFREIINRDLHLYAAAQGKAEKSAIVSKAMDIIRKASPNGSFVKLEKGVWFEVSGRYAREKVGTFG